LLVMAMVGNCGKKLKTNRPSAEIETALLAVPLPKLPCLLTAVPLSLYPQWDMP
jgi:hypothetical protein